MNNDSDFTYAKWLVVALVAGCAATFACHASAQTSGESADELLHDADNVLGQLDANQFSEVWLNAADFVKTRITQNAFIADMQRARQTVGLVRHRGWASVTRIRYTGVENMPDGLYANVDYATTQITGTTVYEKLSFRLDSDGHWHLTGYVPRQSQGEIR